MHGSDFMTITKYDIKCPKCNSKNRFKVNDELDDIKIDDVINRSIFHLSCKKCNQDIYVEYPFKISNERFIIHYTPMKKEEIQDDYREYMRICDTFDDLKEKLMIYNDNLNDIIVEFIKDFLLNQMDKELKSNSTELRYNGIEGENILFSIIDHDKIIGCNKVFYDNLMKKMKFKKNKKCVLIDKNTYHKYYKMRLF